ncbi:MAG: hypothetical protein AAFY84_05885 [Pseudomonadota bacterium]
MAERQNWPHLNTGMKPQEALQQASVVLLDAQIDLVLPAVMKGLPNTLYSTFEWGVYRGVPPVATFSVQANDESVFASVGFYRTGDGAFMVRADLLGFEKRWQRNGYGSDYARSLLDLSVSLGASRITTQANIDIGSYAWARMGARPADPEAVKISLLERINTLSDEKYWTADEGAQMRRCLENDDPDFMYQLASQIAPDRAPQFEKRLGFELLSDCLIGQFAWEAYWDLTESAYLESVKARLRR